MRSVCLEHSPQGNVRSNYFCRKKTCLIMSAAAATGTFNGQHLDVLTEKIGFDSSRMEFQQAF